MGLHTWYISMASRSNLNCLQINFFFFFANCQTCKQKPGTESQAVFYLGLCISSSNLKTKKPTKTKQPKKPPKLEVKSAPLWQQGPGVLFLITVVPSSSSQHNWKNWERNVVLQLELSGNSVAMERIRAESISFLLLMNTEKKSFLSLS